MSTRLLHPLAAASLTLGLHLAAAAADPQPVKRPLYIYIFDGSSKADKADDHIKRAVEIWSKAGVTFEPKVEHIKGDRIKELLGADSKLQSYAGEADRDEELGRSERSSLAKLKPNPKSLGVFILDSDWMSKADSDLFQVYINIGSDPSQTPVGRTVAHEIGHLLLGGGHKWKSGLMGDGAGFFPSVDIDKDEAAKAMKRAAQIPK